MHPSQRLLTWAHIRNFRGDSLTKFAQDKLIIDKNKALPPQWQPDGSFEKLLDKPDLVLVVEGSDKLNSLLFWRLLSNPQLRTVLNVMIIHGYDDDFILECLRLTGFHGLNRQVMATYRHFVFDVSLLDNESEFEQVLDYMPKVLNPEEHRKAYYSPWVGQLYALNVLVPVDFSMLTNVASSIAYSRLLEDFANKDAQIAFGDLSRLIARGIELRARMNVNEENEKLKEVLSKIAMHLEPYKNKTLEELIREELSDEPQVNGEGSADAVR